MHLQSLLCRLYFTCKERPNRIFIVAFGIDYGAPRETRTLTRQSLNLPPLPNWAIGAFIQDTKKAGLEPASSRFYSRRSNHLSYSADNGGCTIVAVCAFILSLVRIIGFEPIVP